MSEELLTRAAASKIVKLQLEQKHEVDDGYDFRQHPLIQLAGRLDRIRSIMSKSRPSKDESGR